MLSFIALLRIQRKENMDAISSFASLYYLMDLLVQSLVVVPLFGTVVGLVLMVMDFHRRTEFKSARYAVDNAQMASTSTCAVPTLTKRAPTPAEVATAAIEEAVQSSVATARRCIAA